MNDLGSLLWEYNNSEPVGKTVAFTRSLHAFIKADRLDLALGLMQARELRELNRTIKNIAKASEVQPKAINSLSGDKKEATK